MGHSFVRALVDFCERDATRHNMGLDVETKPVHFVTEVDGKDVVFHNHIYDWLDTCPEDVKSTHLCLLDLGTNDLKSFFKNDGKSLACNMLTAAIKLRHAGVRRVCIFEIMERDGYACVPMKYWDTVTQAQIDAYVFRFNESVHEYNELLQQLVKDIKAKDPEDKVCIDFLQWRGLKHHHPDHLADGLHLQDQYKPVYWQNMRRQIIRQCPKGRPIKREDLAVAEAVQEAAVRELGEPSTGVNRTQDRQ